MRSLQEPLLVALSPGSWVSAKDGGLWVMGQRSPPLGRLGLLGLPGLPRPPAGLLGPPGPPGGPGSSWVPLDLWGCMGLRPERDCGAWGTGLLCQASWSLGLLGTPTRRKQPHPPHPLRYGTTYSLFPTPKHTSHYMQGSLTNTPPVTCQEPKNEAKNQGKKTDFWGLRFWSRK